MNQANLIGRLTKDPEFRNTPKGVSICRFSIAVPKRSDRTKAYFIKIVTWRGLAENCRDCLKKGKQVGVTGEITSSSYDKDGVRHYVTEINADIVDFLSPKDNDIPQGFIPGEEQEPPF